MEKGKYVVMINKVKIQKTIVIMTLFLLSIVLNGCGKKDIEKGMVKEETSSVSESKAENEETVQLDETESESTGNTPS